MPVVATTDQSSAPTLVDNVSSTPQLSPIVVNLENILQKMRNDISNNINHQSQFFTLVRICMNNVYNYSSESSSDAKNTIDPEFISKFKAVADTIQNLQQDMRNFIQFSINLNKHDKSSNSLMNHNKQYISSIYEQFSNDKFDDMAKIMKQLESDINFKEQKIIKYENLLNDAEYKIEDLEYELSNVTKEKLAIQSSRKANNSDLPVGSDESNDPTTPNSTNIAEMTAMIKSKDSIIDKLHADIEQFETKNTELSKQIFQLDQYAQFTTLTDLKENSPVFTKVKDFIDLLISDKRAMEHFFINKLYNSENIINSDLRSYSEMIQDAIESMNNTILEQKTYPNEEKIQELIKENTTLQNEIKITLSILNRRNAEIQNLKIFLTQLKSHRKQSEIEKTRLMNLILKYQSNKNADSSIEEIRKHSSLTNIDESTLLKYLDWISNFKLSNIEKNTQKELSNPKDQLLAIVALFKQCIEKTKLFIKLQKVRLSKETAERLAKIELSERVASLKKKEEFLIKELDITGNAFEQLQDQNTDLLEQLEQRDESMKKLNNDYTQLESIIKLRNDQLKELQGVNESLKIEIKLQQEVMMKMESHNDNVNKAVSQIDIANKKLLADKLVFDQTIKQRDSEISELKGELERYRVASDLLQSSVTELESSIIGERTVKRKLLAQIKSLQNQLTILKTSDKSEHTDGIQDSDQNYSFEDIPLLMEEIREYKSKLTCPCCNFRQKNAILLRCFHIFCMECLVSRYETRQRKCPKCNAYFGQNDYKKIYL